LAITAGGGREAVGMGVAVGGEEVVALEEGPEAGVEEYVDSKGEPVSARLG
jgi:hypothetical protein